MLHRLFLFLFFIHLSILVQSQVQDSLITIEFNEIPVSEALSRLNSNTSFRFAYNSGDLKTDTISISFLKKDLAFILSNILPQNYSYSVRNKLVIVYQKDLNKPSIESPTAVDFSIRGTVLDLQKKEPLPYAYLYIPSKNLFTESDKYGNFIFHQVPNDTALIKVEYIGYITKVFYLNPKMDKENIQIYLSNANVINEVNVRPYELPISLKNDGSANVINTLKTKSVSNLGETDALALVKYVSGFNPAADGDDVYSFNGLKPDENSYQLDGVNVLSPSHFYGLFSSINALSIKNTRVFRGTYSAQYGGRVGTFVELTSVDGKSKKPEFIIKSGLLSTSARLNSSILNENGSFSFSTRRSYNPILRESLYDPLINNIYNSNVSFAGENGLINVSESNASADVKFSDSYGKFTVDLTKKLKFQLSGHYNDDLTNQELQDEIAEGEINISYTTEMFWKNYGGSAGFKYTLSPKLSIRSQLSFGDFLNTSNSLQENFDMVVNETQTLQSGLSINLQELNQKTQVEFAFSDSLKILAGLEFSNHELKQQERSFGFLLDERTDSKRTQSGFIENMFGWKKTKTTLGLRISKYDGNLYNSPRIKSSIKLTNTISAYAAFGKHYQFLRKIIPLNIFAGTIDQWELAGEDTPVTSKDQFTLGIQKKTKRINFSLELNRIIQKNAVESRFSLLPGANAVTINLNDLIIGMYKSTTVNSAITYHKNRHNISISYTGGKSAGTFNLDDTEIQFRNSRMSDHSLSGLWLWTNSKFSFSGSIIYASGKPITPVLGQYAVELINEEFRPFFVFGNINSATTPDFFRIDFSGSYKTHLNKNMVLEFDLSIQNIFNRKNIKFQSNTFLETENQEEFIILQREINYLGRTPSLFITLYL